MLTESSVERILERLPGLTIGVLGDLFLDRYLDIDASLTEPSIETGLDAYQVVRVRSHPGAAGTVINNLAAFGIKRIYPIAVIGDDGEGYELRQALRALPAVDTNWVLQAADRRTPTYTKPLLQETGHPSRELNRLDIKNRHPLCASIEDAILQALEAVARNVQALIILDQVSEPNCGVVTERVRERLATLGDVTFVLADSRERIGQFRSVCLKPNESECRRAVGGSCVTAEEAASALAGRTGGSVFCTCGEAGILLAEAGVAQCKLTRIPAYPVSGPIDIVGAGDSTSAAIACAVAGGSSFQEAAAFGCLVASITIQQIGTTGTARPAQIRQRFRDAGEKIRSRE